MKVHASALKHGVDPDDALIAASDPVFVADLDEDSPARQFRLGFDSTGRLLELVVLRFRQWQRAAYPRHEGTSPVPRPAQLTARTRAIHSVARSTGL